MIDVKDLLLQTGVAVTFVLGIVNLYFNLKSARRTAFINTVTSERVKWISHVRENISKLCATTDQWVWHRSQGNTPELQRTLEQIKIEIKLQLNPNDESDQEISRLIDDLPSHSNPMDPAQYSSSRDLLVEASQKMLKREWDKVKAEAVEGDLRPSWARRT